MLIKHFSHSLSLSLSVSLCVALLGIGEYKDNECPIAKAPQQQPQQQKEV
jgi:hypothetical protein